jgi:hypothetical protein
VVTDGSKFTKDNFGEIESAFSKRSSGSTERGAGGIADTQWALHDTWI